MIRARRSRGDMGMVRHAPGEGLALGVVPGDVLGTGAGTIPVDTPEVGPGIDPGPALASVVYTSAVMERDSSCWVAVPVAPLVRAEALMVSPVTFTARGSCSSRNRNSSTEKKDPVTWID